MAVETRPIMLKQRVITAIVLVTFILAALFLLPTHLFQLLIAAGFMLGGWEWARMSGLTSHVGRAVYAVMVLGLSLMLLQYTGIWDGSVDLLKLRDAMGAACLFWSIALLWVMGYPGSAGFWGAPWVRLIMGFIIICSPVAALSYLVSLNDGRWFFIYLVGVVASADIGAYFAGKQFGKSKLAPKVSPGKSWAGFWGGMASSAIFSFVCGQAFNVVGLAPMALVAVTAITFLASVLGDLVESMVKRHSGIKDSSQLLPGHGGIMDRIDSVSAAAPVFVLLSILLQVGS
ncbi:Phosphatidate cytidylyltransferase [BD1-7 clade bacterium]|uniref:Phosphatidate cytidylyltransferase n=1 Tax=BD1-7 clade bacterium TaxID=2029982 RepID=A0A5S9PVX0_9GAMM|nr:Phosphatidate cytidylyltransferase [BD1-7 clade bacterium]